MNIKDLQKLMKSGIIVTEHARVRMFERKISIVDIRKAISTGEVIETYQNRKPRPTYLIHGNNIHVVVSTDGKRLYYVTAYKPDHNYFEPDNKTRKKE